MRSLLPNYVQRPAELNTMVAEMAEMIYNGDMDSALRLMRTYLTTIPYCDNTHYEGHYQQLLYVIFTLIGNYVDVEVRTPQGRVDHGAPHTFHALRDRAETRQKRRSSHGANRFEGLPRTFRALRSAGGEGGDQFQYGEEDDRGVEDNFAIG